MASQPSRAEAQAWRAVWTRGEGCAELATLLDPEAVRAERSPDEACLAHRADLLVTRRLSTRTDLVSLAVPHDLDLETVESVTGLVSGGPHSGLAARLTLSLAERLAVPGRLVSAFHDVASRAEAEAAVTELSLAMPDAETSLVEAAGAGELFEALGSADLVVMGAPGGSLLQRHFFGPGARLQSRAPAGTVVVRTAPARVFQVMGEPDYVSRHLGAGEAFRLHPARLVAVVEAGTLIGVAVRSDLMMAGDGATVESCMRAPRAVVPETSVDEALRLSYELGGLPVPVVDGANRLVGMFRP